MKVKSTRSRGGTQGRRSALPRARRDTLPPPPSGRSDVLPEQWTLRLYIAGQTPRSLTAFANLKRICEAHLAGRYQIELIDLATRPDLARGDQIVALPTLVRKLPTPVKRIIGDLSNAERVLLGIDIQPLSPRTGQTTPS